MSRIQVSNNFYLDEFVTPEVYNQWGKFSKWFFDERLIDLCQYLREELNAPITINNWWHGGSYRDSGLRDSHSYARLRGNYIKTMSQHKFGKAVDLKIATYTPKEVEQFIQENWQEIKTLGLTTIEDTDFTPTWLHLDLRNTGAEEILIVRP